MRDETIKRRLQRAVMAAMLTTFLCASATAQDDIEVHPGVRRAPSGSGGRATQPATELTTGASAVPESMFYTAPPGGSPMAIETASLKTASVRGEEESTGKDKNGGIKIHGHWVIEVKRKDGTVKERREFENSYVGGYIMGLYLAGFDAPADPVILLSSATNTGSSLCNGGTYNVCVIAESLTAGQGAVDVAQGYCASNCYAGLTSSLGTSGTGPWVLQATVTPTNTGTFDTVTTSIAGCYSPYFNSTTSISPAACYANAVTYANNDTSAPTSGPLLTDNNFTSTVLPGGLVTVTAGETLVFTVTISFS